MFQEKSEKDDSTSLTCHLEAFDPLKHDLSVIPGHSLANLQKVRKNNNALLKPKADKDHENTLTFLQ